MAQRGPKPTPTRILELRGSWRGKTRPQEPTAVAEIPPMPRWLNAESKRLWKQVTTDLQALGLLTRIDGNAIARYVSMLAQWRKLVVFIEEHGWTYESRKTYRTGQKTSDDGTVIPHHTVEVTEQALYPQARLMLALADRLLRLEQSFGMSPASRASIGLELARAAVPKTTHPLTDARRFLRLDRAD